MSRRLEIFQPVDECSSNECPMHYYDAEEGSVCIHPHSDVFHIPYTDWKDGFPPSCPLGKSYD